MNRKNNKEIEQNKIKDNNTKKNSFEEIINNDNKQQIEIESLENSDIKRKHYNIILISSPGKIAKDKKEIIESCNTIMKNNNKYQNQNSIRMNKYIIDDNKELIKSYKEKDNSLINYEGNNKMNSPLENLYKNNTFNIGLKNKNIYSDK